MIKASKPKLVPDVDLPSAYEAMAAANPFRQTRLEAAQVAALGIWFTSPEMVAAGMLLGTSDTPDMLEKILPGQIVLYNKQHVPAMRLKTATGLVHGVFMPDLLTLHADATEAEQAAERQRRAEGAAAKPGVEWHHHYFAMQGIGRRHSMVMPEAVETTCALMEAKHVPLGIYDLLRGAGLNAPKRVGWIGTMAGMTVGEVSWLLEIDYSYYTIVMTHKGLALYARGDDSPLGQVDYATLAKRKVDMED